MKIALKFIPGAIAFALCAQDTKPSCSHCSATYVSNDELQTFLKRAPSRIVANDVSDQQVRALDIGKLNVDIGIVYRRALTGENPVAEHDLVSEVYHVIDGSATLVTGPDIVGAVRRPATNENVRLLNGPGSNGTSIRNGATYHLKPGDVIVIPAGVGHWFTKIDDHIRYLMVRLDPDKVTPLKDEAAAKADLAK
jgi:oxalate decarboxylase/phosphoglucose isomerase-like protein (cupin superfamily)